MLYIHIFKRSSGGNLEKHVNVESVKNFPACLAVTRWCDGIPQMSSISVKVCRVICAVQNLLGTSTGWLIREAKV